MHNSMRFNNIIYRVVLTSFGMIAELLAITLIFNRSISLLFILSIMALVSIVYLVDFFREYSYSLNNSMKRIVNLILIVLGSTLVLTILKLDNLKLSSLFSLLLTVGLLYDPYFKKLSQKIIGFKDLFVVACFNTLLLAFCISLNLDTVTTVTIIAFAITRDFVNITYCDLKDISSDSQRGVRTFATELGINKMINIHLLVSLASIAIITVSTYLKLIPLPSLSLLFPVLITTFLIIKSKESRNFSPTHVDAEYFLWLISILSWRLIWN